VKKVKEMQLIDQVGQLYKMTSVQIAAATGAIAVAEQVMPVLQGVIPPAAYAVLSVLMILARAIYQPKLR
jgi:hypothetical protein